MTLDAFETELIDLLPRLRRFARSLTRNADDADDMVQLGLERALRSRERWQAGTRLDAWMFAIVRNVWIDESRRRTRHAKVLAPAEAGENVGSDPRPAMEARMTARAVEHALQQLPDEQREAVALVLIDGLPYRDAADVLSIPIGTLTSRLGRGRLALIALIEGEAA